ncbi:MAG: dienelactone hydrolase family protein [Sneathiella sp.]|nr:dienelactone hydrolase family protein [Sneathiella sp.]
MGILSNWFRISRLIRNALISLTLVFVISSVSNARTVRYLETDLFENGQSIKLEVVYSMPKGQGPFSLLVFNHGSTGLGKSPEKFKETFWTKAISKFFNDRGWMVAFPQRRGRGKSDGLYDEGFSKDRAQGYSCLPELSLPGVERALEDISAAIEILSSYSKVDANNILIGGVSRGGALSVAYSGHHPNQVKGVINLVGGWMTDKCLEGPSINRAVFLQGVNYKRPTLWLYGKGDPYFSTAHSRWNFEIYKSHGGIGQYFAFDVPYDNGHLLYRYEQVWGGALDNYLKLISKRLISQSQKRPVLRLGKEASPYNDVPLPDDLAITKAETKLPIAQRMFSGFWAGTSDTKLNHILVVEALDMDGGQAVFAIGKSKKLEILKGQWVRLNSVWEGDNLVIRMLDGGKVVYSLIDAERIEAQYFDKLGVQIDRLWLIKSSSFIE